MDTNLEKRINELEAKNAFQEDAIERLSSEVRKQQQEITALNHQLTSALDLLLKGSEIQDSEEKPPHY
ncbi:MAG: SlyX family protein [Gammaproteobacteria bacterium]|nr:MAG: SlyX family protein [Gammaproteobacteria bacterium]|tara:strand:- start:3059 stop:3262 length:204 start_codon:yes stop_codon:yes gene_type:complete